MMRLRVFLGPAFAPLSLFLLLLGGSESEPVCPPALPGQEPATLFDGASSLPRLVADEIILPQRQASFWRKYYPEVVKLVNAAYRGVDLSSTPLHIVEIGTGCAGLADHLMTAFPSSLFTTIDPFILGYDTGDTHSKKMTELATTTT